MKVSVHATDFIKKARVFIEKFIRSEGKKVQEKLKYLDDKLETARKYVAGAKAKTNALKNSINEWRAGLRTQLKELEEKQAAADHDRCFKSCPACRKSYLHSTKTGVV